MAEPRSPTSPIGSDDGSDDDDIRSEVIPSPPPAPAEPGADAEHDAPVVEHEPTNTSDPMKKGQNRRDAAGWQLPAMRRPYREYVHSLVEGGWDMMRDLDKYLETDLVDPGLVVSVLDIAADGSDTKRWPDLHDELALVQFMSTNRQRAPGSVRLYLTEQKGGLAAGVIESLGANLDLDPRFFQWSLVGHKHVLSPSHRHHAPYVRIGFGVPKLETPNRTDAERFNVTVYVKPDDAGAGWTGILIFSTHTKVNVSPHNLYQPPSFSAPRPPKVPPAKRSFRDLFLTVFPSLDLAAAVTSPFYALHVLLRLNYVTWARVIHSIRMEDRRIRGISDTSVGHAEEIAQSLAVVQRAGSFGWKGRGDPKALDARTALEEDFSHLVKETELLWQEREKMAAVRQRRSEHRWNLLTNTFTYVFAPITIISGIYGMNVQEINGSTPDIWQFFVAIIVLNILVLIGLAVANWVHILTMHNRWAGWRETIGFALGRSKHLH